MLWSHPSQRSLEVGPCVESQAAPAWLGGAEAPASRSGVGPPWPAGAPGRGCHTGPAFRTHSSRTQCSWQRVPMQSGILSEQIRQARWSGETAVYPGVPGYALVIASEPEDLCGPSDGDRWRCSDQGREMGLCQAGHSSSLLGRGCVEVLWHVWWLITSGSRKMISFLFSL